MVDPIKPVVREVKETSRIWVILSLVLFATTLGGAVIIFAFEMPFTSPEPSVTILEELAQMEAELETLDEAAMMEEGDAPNGFYDASPEYTFEYPSSVDILYSGVDGPATVTLEFIEPYPTPTAEDQWMRNQLTIEPTYLPTLERDGGVNLDELIGTWEARETVPADTTDVGVRNTETGTLDGRRYLKVVELVDVGIDRAEFTRIYIEHTDPLFVVKVSAFEGESADLTLATILETIDFDPEPEDVEEAE